VPANRSLNVPKRVAIVQSNYIPWKGYFDLIASVDEFVLFDDVQFTRRDWRNRNRIKTPTGLLWLTIPVAVKGKYEQRINETRISDSSWTRKHVASLRHAYGKAASFAHVWPAIEALYAQASDVPLLSNVNHLFLSGLCALLKIETKITPSSNFVLREGKTERLVSLCQELGATHYLSGPSARSYMEPRLFDEAGIVLQYADYSRYPVYEQLHGPFEHAVSMLDLLFNVGAAETPQYMKKLI